MDLVPTIKLVQHSIGVTPDGVAGPLTWAALAARLVPADAELPIRTVPFDSRSEANIATLTPDTQTLARQLLSRLLTLGMNAKVISGHRSYAEQDALYEQGRTKPGPIVTKARGGYSWHNFSVAFDIGLFDSDGEYLEDSPLYAKAGAIGKLIGLEWGGDWQGFSDFPHYQYNPRHYSLADMRVNKDRNEALA